MGSGVTTMPTFCDRRHDAPRGAKVVSMSFNVLQFLARLAAQLDKLDDLIEIIDRLLGSPHLSAEWWDEIAALGKLLSAIVSIPLAADGATVEALTVSVEAQRLGGGQLFRRVVEFAESPLGQALLGLLLGQLRGT